MAIMQKLVAAGAGLGVFFLSVAAQATIINVDFNGVRGAESLGATYQGVGAAGGGNFWNGVTVNDSASTDNLTVISGPLIADNGTTLTSVSVSIGNAPTQGVGGDNGGAGPAGTSTAGIALFQDYIFVQTGVTPSTTAPFTISGLKANTSAIVYYYYSTLDDQGSNSFVVTGGTNKTSGTLLTDYSGTTDGLYTSYNVTTSGLGTISGTFTVQGSPTFSLLSGLTIVGTVVVPEPTTAAASMLAASGFFILRRRRLAN